MSRTCAAPECDRAGRGGGGGKLCEAHYWRLRKYGTYDLPERQYAKDSPCAGLNCSSSASGLDGYCNKHRARVRKHGDPNVALVDHEDPERRFWSHVNKTGTCWLWTSTHTWDGYGLFGVKGRRTGAHRFAYEFAVGPIPDGLQLDHLCEVRDCVNPAHLEPVTQAENTRRVWEGRG